MAFFDTHPPGVAESQCLGHRHVVDIKRYGDAYDLPVTVKRNSHLKYAGDV